MKRVSGIIITTVITAFIAVIGYLVIDYRLGRAGHNPLEKEDPFVVKYLAKEFVLEPGAEFWKDIKPVRVHLYPQSARVPHGTLERELLVRAAHNGREIAFLLEFKDGTEDRGAPVNPDACAILFVPNPAPATAQMMGYASKANVWQWLADRDAERFQRGDESIKAVRELIASGPGTQTPLKDQNVDGKGQYRDGMWSVVFKRPLKSQQEGEFEFEPGVDKKIAFALWDGTRMESFSRKSIAILRTLRLEKP